MTRDFPLCVVMPAHNAERYIEDALSSLFAQTRTDFEIIVVDDGSTDRTADIVRRVASSTGTEPLLRLMQQDRKGPSAARNSAIEATSAGLIGFLDADDRWSADKVEKQLALLEADQMLDLTFTGFRFIDASGTDLNEPALPDAGGLTHALLLERNCIHTSTVIARRAAILREGGFDEALRTYEDFDLWLKIAANGPRKVGAVREILADYRRHGEQATGNWETMHSGWQAVVAKQAKNHPEVWSDVRRIAEGNQYEYCAALAYNANDIPAARRLIGRCWRAGGIAMLWRREVLLVTAICGATYLPRPLQVFLGKAYTWARQIRANVSGVTTRPRPNLQLQDRKLD